MDAFDALIINCYFTWFGGDGDIIFQIAVLFDRTKNEVEYSHRMGWMVEKE